MWSKAVSQQGNYLKWSQWFTSDLKRASLTPLTTAFWLSSKISSPTDAQNPAESKDEYNKTNAQHR